MSKFEFAPKVIVVALATNEGFRRHYAISEEGNTEYSTIKNHPQNKVEDKHFFLDLQSGVAVDCEGYPVPVIGHLNKWEVGSDMEPTIYGLNV